MLELLKKTAQIVFVIMLMTFLALGTAKLISDGLERNRVVTGDAEVVSIAAETDTSVVVNLEEPEQQLTDNGGQVPEPISNATYDAASTAGNLYSLAEDMAYGRPNDVTNAQIAITEKGLSAASNAVDKTTFQDRPVLGMVDSVVLGGICLLIISSVFGGLFSNRRNKD